MGFEGPVLDNELIHITNNNFKVTFIFKHFVVCISHLLSPLLFYLMLIDEKGGSKKLKNVPKVTQLVYGGAGT